MSDLEQLKFNLLESRFPYFSDVELQTLLDQYGDIKTATYNGCLIKAQDDSLNLGPIKMPSNEKFWIRRAKLLEVMLLAPSIEKMKEFTNSNKEVSIYEC